MIKVSIYRNKKREGEPEEIREVSSKAALDLMITALFFDGFVEENVLMCESGNSKADAVRISVMTSLLGIVPAPYLMVFEGLLENEMSTLGIVLEWFVKATESASADILHKILS